MSHAASAPDPRRVIGIGIAFTAVFVAALVFLMARSTFDMWGGLVIGPLVFIATIPMLARQAKREGDDRLFTFLLLALVIKLLGCLARYFITFVVYGGVSDSIGYHGAGITLRERFLDGNFDPGPMSTPVSSTNFIEVVTGVMYMVTGPTLLGAYFVYSWLAFIGTFYMYRAFKLAVPGADAHGYAKTLLFLPSILYWPSSLGKEAWMMFALGIASYGIALLLSRRPAMGLVITAVGMWMASIVRAHVGGMIAIGVVIALLIRPSRKELGQLIPLAKGVSFAAALVVGLLLVSNTSSFLEEKGLETGGGVAGVLAQATERSDEGGSSFTPPTVDSPVKLPLATLTVLFRPLPIEAGNPQMLGAALEGLFLMGLAYSRRKQIFQALGSSRRTPYIAVAALFVLFFIITFSAIGNFGILTRQRVQVLPYFLALIFAIPKEEREHSHA